MIVEAFVSHLKANAPLMALCRWIYPHEIPKETEPPALVFALDEDERIQTLAGQAAYRQALMSVDCYTLRELDSHSLADAVESALIGFRGTFGTTSPIIDVDHIRLERRFSDKETSTGFYRVSMQFFIGYE